jgi:hypothetical protein
MMQAIAAAGVTKAWTGSPLYPQLTLPQVQSTKCGCMSNNKQNNDVLCRCEHKLLSDALSICSHFKLTKKKPAMQQTMWHKQLPYVGKRTVDLTA